MTDTTSSQDQSLNNKTDGEPCPNRNCQHISSSTQSTLSSRSSVSTCRICQDSRVLESLISPCYCMGTMGFVHSSCLEKWLGQSGRSACELCKFEFRTQVTYKTFRDWIITEDFSLLERRYILTDLACFLLLTPLGIVSSWLCINGAQQYYINEHFWTGFALVILTGLLTMLYFFWVTITLRYHYLAFTRWQRQNGEVQLIFSNISLNDIAKHKMESRCSNDNVDEIIVTQTRTSDAMNSQQLCASV